MATEEQRACCINEKNRMVKELKKCDLAASKEERVECRRGVTKDSGKRGRNCML